MKDHCRNLNSIHLQHITIDFINEEGKGAYVDMICSFGSQLVQVDLVPWLTEGSLVQIVRECVNIRFKANFALNISKLSIVADRLETLKLVFNSSNGLDSENLRILSAAMGSCSLLTNLKVSIRDLMVLKFC